MRYTLTLVILFTTTTLFAQKVLFVGNSLTYSNDLPGIIETIGNKFGKNITGECVCKPNYGLEDHWNEGLIQNKLRTEKFDYVLFQQGPSSQAYGRSSLFDFGGNISALAKENKTQPGYFMVWPSVQYYHTFEGVIKNHTEAAEYNDAFLVPVGEIWKEFRQSTSESNLYSIDQFHPSKAGSFLAALTIVKTIFPEIELPKLSYKTFRGYFSSKKDFEVMIQLVGNNELQKK